MKNDIYNGTDKEIDFLINRAERNGNINKRVNQIFDRTYPDGRCPAGEFIVGKGWIDFIDPEKEAKRRIRETMLPGGEMGEI